MTRKKTIVFGLDGAHFELVEPWVAAGELPNVATVFDRGVTGDLQSVLPPVTSPNWKAYATGKNPGKIGIFWWENVDVRNRRVHYPTERKHGNTEFWELIAEDESVGVVNVPTTYPPKSVDSFLIAGPPDGADAEFTHPPELEATLREEFDYRVNKRHRLRDDRERAVAEITRLVDLRFRVAKALLEREDPAFLQITTFYLNSLHHYLWDDEATLEGWKIVDDHLGDFLDAGHNVVLMSDHGSTEIQTAFHVNAWLEREGYLELDMGVTNALHRLGVNSDRLLSLAARVGVRDLASRHAPGWLVNRLPDAQGSVSSDQKTDNVDWDQTAALASGQGPIYLVPENADDGVRDELVRKLEDLTTPDGRPVAEAVYEGREIYSGEYLEEAPDLVIDQAPGIHIPGSVGRDEVFTAPEDDGWRAENKRSGLFAATGPDFREGRVADLSILDLAPTLLHLHGCAVPMDMDGDVRRSLFAEGSDPRDREVAYTESTREPREREKRLIRQIARRADL